MQPLESLQLNSLPLTTVSAMRQLRHWLKRQVAVANLAVILGIASGLLVTHEIAPPAVQAYTGTVNVTIDVQPTETYDTLVRRAEAIARAATQRSFDRDILVTDVSIMILAQSAASTVPVLSLTTTRPQWRSQPDPRRWATYYSTSKALLRLNNTPTATTVQPTITTTTATPPRSTAPSTPKTPTAPTASPATGGSTGASQPSTTKAPGVIPQRIPTPGNIGK